MFVLSLIAVCWCTSILVETAPQYTLEDAALYFEDFIRQYDRQYADEQEKETRFQIFKDNLQDIIRLNEKSQHAEYGITQFMDLTREEFQNKYTGFNPSDPDSRDGEPLCTIKYDNDIPDAKAPESWDWREHGVVTEVKNQALCSSCYAFAVTGHLEAQYAIKHKQLLKLSEQQIVDCDRRSGGCCGGSMQGALRSLIEMGGIEKSDDYPYKGKHQNCTFDKNKVAVKIIDCYAYRLTSQEKVKQLLYETGPITIGISSLPLNKYHRGIRTDEDTTLGTLDHAVLLVGYGTEQDIPYWIVKNSWGPYWGENGYFRMQRGEGALSCGMMLEDNPGMTSAVIE